MCWTVRTRSLLTPMQRSDALAELARRLRRWREQRGSLDFDLPEAMRLCSDLAANRWTSSGWLA